MDTDTRIRQFEELCEQEPDNDMAWFSLGGAYTQAERFAEAAGAYAKCYEANATFSKAYQLAGASLIKAGEPEKAAEVLEKGYAVAAEQGDLMPKNGIAELLQGIGRDVPETAPAPSAPAPGEGAGSFVCQRTGRPGTRMPRPPFKGPVGEWIQSNIAKETFDEWVGMGTKIINELRLDLSRDQDETVYDYGMRRFIGLTDEKYEELSGERPPPPPGEYVELIDTILARSGNLESFGGEMHRQV